MTSAGTTSTTPAWLQGIENFFTGLGNDVSSLEQNITNDITWLENEASAIEKELNAALPDLFNTAQSALSAVQGLTAALFPGVTSIITLISTVIKSIENIFETTGSQAPGGTSPT